MSKELETITLDDGLDYIVTDEFEIDGVKYIYLSNENDIASFCIRKMNTINGNEYLVGLNDRNEFNMALEKFLERHQND